jgi:hypothetical protein
MTVNVESPLSFTTIGVTWPNSLKEETIAPISPRRGLFSSGRNWLMGMVISERDGCMLLVIFSSLFYSFF